MGLYSWVPAGYEYIDAREHDVIHFLWIDLLCNVTDVFLQKMRLSGMDSGRRLQEDGGIF